MIYIHVPFCHRKCTYCAFHSKPAAGGSRSVESYIDALLAEMELRRGELPHPVHTLYFGGGTPSIIPIKELERIIATLHRHFNLSRLEEFTLEANPEDLTPDYLSAIHSLGINRLSVGIQSLDDTMLRMLNRRHTARQALDALENAHRAGFHNISADFIYGLPLSTFHFPLSSITHISAYALTVESGTALELQVRQGRVVLPGEEEVVRQYYALRQQFEEEGFHQYEVSNFARPGFESKHNSRYWNRTPYLGLGPGAHSFDGHRRRWNLPDNLSYINSIGNNSQYFEIENLTPTDAFNELLMTSLRTVRGLSVSDVPEEYKGALMENIRPYLSCGWLTLTPEFAIRPTPEGLLHADGMAAALFA